MIKIIKTIKTTSIHFISFLRFVYIFLKKINFKDILAHRLSLFRIFSVVIAIDIISFWGLASINPLQFLNPFQFLFLPDTDQREELTLYYPASFDSNTEETKLIPIKQKVLQVAISEDNTISKDLQDSITKNVFYIVHELSLGSTNLKAKRLFRNQDLLSRVWAYDHTVVLHLNSDIWESYSKEHQHIIQEAILKSILSNIKWVKYVYWAR